MIVGERWWLGDDATRTRAICTELQHHWRAVNRHTRLMFGWLVGAWMNLEHVKLHQKKPGFGRLRYVIFTSEASQDAAFIR